MANEKQLNLPDLGALVRAGSNAGAAAKPVVENQPETIDLTGRALDDTSIEQRFRDAGVYGEHGGPLGTSPTAGSTKPVDISHLYGEFGGKVLDAPTQAKGAEPVDLSSLYGERGGLLQTQTLPPTNQPKSDVD